MRLLSMAFAWVLGLVGLSSEEETQQDSPEIITSYMTTDSATDTGDTGEPLDTAVEEPTDTETGDPEDSGDTAGDSATVDTALKSAMDLAGENGGFGCATASPDAALSILVGGMVVIGFRRKED